MHVFMRAALPEASEIDARLGRRPDHDELSKVGKHFSESSRSPAEIEVYAGAMADMFLRVS